MVTPKSELGVRLSSGRERCGHAPEAGQMGVPRAIMAGPYRMESVA